MLTEIRPSYRFILQHLIEALGVPQAEQAGISDLALLGRKFSGNAQQRKRNHLLHHGTILYAFDAALVGRYLRPPPRQPEYRGQRDHEAFLCNLHLSRDQIVAGLRSGWQANEEITAWPTEEVQRLVAEKHGTEAWSRRR
jgi:lipoate-protein ligase A